MSNIISLNEPGEQVHALPQQTDSETKLAYEKAKVVFNRIVSYPLSAASWAYNNPFVVGVILGIGYEAMGVERRASAKQWIWHKTEPLFTAIGIGTVAFVGLYLLYNHEKKAWITMEEEAAKREALLKLQEMEMQGIPDAQPQLGVPYGSAKREEIDEIKIWKEQVDAEIN